MPARTKDAGVCALPPNGDGKRTSLDAALDDATPRCRYLNAEKIKELHALRRQYCDSKDATTDRYAMMAAIEALPWLLKRIEALDRAITQIRRKCLSKMASPRCSGKVSAAWILARISEVE